MKIGDRRVIRSHSGRRWIVQIRTRARGLAAALGAVSQWGYEGHSFATEAAAKAYLRREYGK